jgi:hypothetical protein
MARYLGRLNGFIHADYTCTSAPLLISFHCIGSFTTTRSSSYGFHGHPGPRLTMSIATATEILEILGPIAEAIPILGTPVKSALEVISKILKYADVCSYFLYSS